MATKLRRNFYFTGLPRENHVATLWPIILVDTKWSMQSRHVIATLYVY